MRTITLTLSVALLAACQTAVEPPVQRSAAKQAEYDRLLAGKVAGPPVNCLPTTRARDMTVIDEDTILFRDGRSVYVNTPRGSCAMLGRSNYALVTRNFGPQMCSGDISQVVDPTTGITVGGCALGDFVPYRGS